MKDPGFKFCDKKDLRNRNIHYRLRKTHDHKLFMGSEDLGVIYGRAVTMLSFVRMRGTIVTIIILLYQLLRTAMVIERLHFEITAVSKDTR